MLQRLLVTLILLPLGLLASPRPYLQTGMVQDLNTGEVRKTEQASLPMSPASTTKLLTGYAALHYLGPDFTFKTEALTKDNIVYLKFSGDPTLTYDQIVSLIDNGIKFDRIVIDNTAFVDGPYARGWHQDDLPWYYAAPIVPTIIDANQFVLTNQDGKLVADNPLVTLKTHIHFVPLEESETLCQLEVDAPAPFVIDIHGCWPDNTPLKQLKVANRYPLETLSTRLENQFGRPVSVGTTPVNASHLATHRSPPLRELLHPLLADSNNVVAEALTKTIGEKAYGRASFQAGSYAIQTHVHEALGLKDKQFALYDGSGLSSLNLIPADVLAQLLVKIYQDNSVKGLMVSQLAISGESGTLKHRLDTLPYKFVGKTGGMTHVSNLAGYYGLESSQPLVVVVMANQVLMPWKAFKQIETKSVKEWVRQ